MASPVRPARRVPSVVVVLCLAAVGLSAGRARAQSPPVDGAAPWSALPVPGGVAALLQAAELDPSRPRTTALLDVVRLIHAVRPGLVPEVDARRAAVVAYLTAVEEFTRARARIPGEHIQRSQAANRSTRKAMQALAAAMGAGLVEKNGPLEMTLVTGKREEQRRAGLKLAGLDVEAVAAGFNLGSPARLDITPSDTVPLPLPESSWRPLFKGSPAGLSLAASIVVDRRASLLYYGLCSVDEETRSHLAAHPQVLAHVYESDRAGIVALHGRSLHVRSGRIDPPGGEQAVVLWEAITGERVSDPDRFILAVLSKDEGRLAHLYDAVDQMEPPAQAFALGLWIADAGRRLERFRALHAACLDALVGWDPAGKPFARTMYDPAHLLLVARVNPDGRPGSLGWLGFWQKAFEADRLPERPEEELTDVEKAGPLDAASLLQTVIPRSFRTRRELCEAWCFGQRLFAAVPRSSLPQVLVAIRGFVRYTTLGLTLERLHVTDPSVYAAAFQRAEQITRIGDPARSAFALSLYQGALVLVERARLARVLDIPATARLIASLSRLPLSADGVSVGGSARWIENEYLPAIGADATREIEPQVLAAFAGRRPGSALPDRTAEYEGTLYRVDPPASVLDVLKAVRERQGGASLDAVMSLAREARDLVRVQNLAQLPSRIDRLKSAASAVLQAQPAPSSGWSRHADLADALRETVGVLGSIRRTQDLRKVESAAETMQRSAEWELGRVLASLAYAASIGDPESTALVAGDPSALHEWHVATSEENVRARGAWAVPKETHDIGSEWHVAGSLLALDIGLAAEALHRLSSDAPSSVPTISDNDRRAVTEAAVLANVFDYLDADMALLAEALGRGRARVAVLAGDPGRLPDLSSAAGLDTGRRNLLAWALVHEPGQASRFFSLGDLLCIGGIDAGSVRALDAWGTSGLSYDGRLRLRFPSSRPFPALSGRFGGGLLPTLVADMALLTAEALHERHLPAVLARSMLLIETPDYMDRLALAHEDDWMTLASDVQRILPSHIDDYLAAITTGGPLVPLRKANGGDRD
jgi:hypothetical protein